MTKAQLMVPKVRVQLTSKRQLEVLASMLLTTRISRSKPAKLSLQPTTTPVRLLNFMPMQVRLKQSKLLMMLERLMAPRGPAQLTSKRQLEVLAFTPLMIKTLRLRQAKLFLQRITILLILSSFTPTLAHHRQLHL